VVESHYPNEDRPTKPRPEGKRIWASVAKERGQVTQEIFREALQQDPHQEKVWVALVDGDKKQIRLLESQAKSRNLKLTVIVDIIHVLEYIWKASCAFYAEGSRERESWVGEQFYRVLQGKSSQVAAAMRRKATKLKLSQTKRKSVNACARYLLTYKQYLRYQVYLSKGWPIASGVIEGACRHLIKDRMDRTGARWSLKGAEAVLKIRSLVSSGDFDAYWQFHEQQELQRNHGESYEVVAGGHSQTLKFVKPKNRGTYEREGAGLCVSF
jgi:hypothetical protein